MQKSPNRETTTLIYKKSEGPPTQEANVRLQQVATAAHQAAPINKDYEKAAMAGMYYSLQTRSRYFGRLRSHGW